MGARSARREGGMRYYDDTPLPPGPMCSRCGERPPDPGCWWCVLCDEEWGASQERERMHDRWNEHPHEAQRYTFEAKLRFTNTARRKRGAAPLMLGYRP